MQNRGSIYVALLLILAGLFFFVANIAWPILRVGCDVLWPGFLALGALAFYLPIVVWWEQRRNLAGLAVPGTILLVNAAIFLYNALSGDWDAWAYLWALEPLSVGLGLYAAWLAGLRHYGLLVGGSVLTAIGLLLFSIFGMAFGSAVARVLAPFVLIVLGALLLLRSLLKPGYRTPRAPTSPGSLAG